MMFDRRSAIARGTAAVAGVAALAGQGVSKAAAPARLRPRGARLTTRDGCELFHRDWGRGPPILFGSAWGMTSDSWQYQMLPLSEAGLRCVAYDRRGHGRSGDPGGGYDKDALADDVACVIDQLDLRDVTLVGFSMSAVEMVRYLSRHGSGRVARLVLIAPTTPFLMKTADNPGGMDPSIFTSIRGAVVKDFPAFLGATGKGFLDASASVEIGGWIKGMMQETSLQALVECNRMFTTADLRDDLRRLTVPTLIIQGDADLSAPLQMTGKPTAALVRGSTLKVYEGAPHGLIFTHTQRVNSDLREFIRA